MRKLKLLMMALALIVGGSNAWAQETPKDGSAYYIYNETNGLFFTRGAAWGTQAFASPVGIPWRVEISDGKYTLKMNDIYLQDTDANGKLGYNGSYTDNDTPIALTPSGNASDGYTLKNGDNYITCPSSKGVVSMTTTASTWKFLTQAQYDAVLAARASTQETAVATSKGISIPGGSTLAEVVSDASAWTSTTTNDGVPTKEKWPITGNDRNGAYNEGTYGVELFQANDAYISKTISGLAQGIYKITVRGMKRMGANEGSVALESAGFYVSDAYMEANGNIIPLKAWASDNTANDVPNDPAAVVTIIGNGGYTNEGFVYVGADGNLSLSIHTDAFWWSGWMVFNGISYTYYNNEVTDEEAEALLATVPTAPMLKATKDALDLAKSNFESSHTYANYNALRTAIDNANASISVYAPLGTKLTEAATVKSSVSSNSPSYVTTFDTNIATINTNYTGGLIAESNITTQIAAVETEILKLVKSQTVSGSDMTRALPNAACTGDVGDDNWKIKNALASGEFFRLDTWAGTASGMSVPMIEYWIANGNTLSSNEIYQTITGLENGLYTVTATTAVNNESKEKEAPNEGSALLFANDATKDITSGGTETQFKGQTGTFSVNVVLTDDDKGNLKLGLKTVSPNYNWIAFKNFTLTYYGPVAEDADYTALQDAIDAAEAKTLGFEDGEYAPYSNVDALKALADAKAIDQKAPNTKTVVNNATSALTGATWTANVGEVNAFYNPSFALSDNDGAMIGWKNSNAAAGLGGATHSCAFVLTSGQTNYDKLGVFNQGEGTRSVAYFRFDSYNSGRDAVYTYGETEGYTIPLKAVSYRLKAKFGSWNQPNKNVKLAVVAEDGTEIGSQTVTTIGTLHDGTGSVTKFDFLFTPVSEGNYKIQLSNPENVDNAIVITAFELKKAVADDVTISEAATSAPTATPLANVTLTRSLAKDNWNTFSVPFNLSAAQIAASALNDATIKKVKSIDDNVITMEDATEIVAGKPYLVKPTVAIVNPVFNSVAVIGTGGETEGEGDYKFVGQVYNKSLAIDGSVAYLATDGKIKKLTSGSIKGLRAYFIVPIGSDSAPARISFFGEDDSTTGIVEMQNDTTAVNNKVYDLNGRCVESIKKGIYVINGKKIIKK